MCDELQKNIKDQWKDQGNSREVIKINGSFSWGFSKKENAEEANPEEGEKKSAKVDEGEKQSEQSLGSFVTLKDIDLTFNKGEFVCIIGDVGAGKTSLLNALTGEMLYISPKLVSDFGGFDKMGSFDDFDKFRGQVMDTKIEGERPIQIHGSMSMVEQSSWIMNKTIRENILFGKPFDADKYNKTVNAC